MLSCWNVFIDNIKAILCNNNKKEELKVVKLSSQCAVRQNQKVQVKSGVWVPLYVLLVAEYLLYEYNLEKVEDRSWWEYKKTTLPECMQSLSGESSWAVNMSEEV